MKLFVSNNNFPQSLLLWKFILSEKVRAMFFPWEHTLGQPPTLLPAGPWLPDLCRWPLMHHPADASLRATVIIVPTYIFGLWKEIPVVLRELPDHRSQDVLVVESNFRSSLPFPWDPPRLWLWWQDLGQTCLSGISSDHGHFQTLVGSRQNWSKQLVFP